MSLEPNIQESITALEEFIAEAEDLESRAENLRDDVEKIRKGIEESLKYDFSKVTKEAMHTYMENVEALLDKAIEEYEG